ncbi:hypothetical protein L1887_50201 [Cichorium endivia]|nr:hypothetical protein L1887_50201 [Cichorium endivia]
MASSSARQSHSNTRFRHSFPLRSAKPRAPAPPVFSPSATATAPPKNSFSSHHSAPSSLWLTEGFADAPPPPYNGGAAPTSFSSAISADPTQRPSQSINQSKTSTQCHSKDDIPTNDRERGRG